MEDYRRPAALADALQLLAASPRRVLAGGTDLYPADVVAVAWDRPGLGHDASPPLLDVTALPELRGIEPRGAGFRLGAAVTWSELVAAPLPPAFDALKQAAVEVGGRQIQNRGTLGGNLCNASPAADGVPPLLVLDAEVELASVRGRRRLPLDRFVRGNRATALAPDELLVAVHVPSPPPGAVAGFAKLGARRYLVISIAMVAVLLGLEAGRIVDARVAVGACSATAQRLPALEADLVGLTPEDAAGRVTPEHVAVLQPIDDVRASAVYRLDAAGTLIARTLASLGAGELAA